MKAQTNEIYLVNGVAWVHRASDESADANVYGLGYNVNRRWSENSKHALVFGIKAFYGYNKTTYNSQDVRERFIRVQVPLSLKYGITTKSSICVEPYAGVDASYFIMGKSKIGNSTYDWFKSHALFDQGVNRAQFGVHAGLDVTWPKFLLGIAYQRDLTKFETDEHFSMLEFKAGYRF